MARMLLVPLFAALCCAGPLLFVAFAPLLWGLIAGNATLITVGVVLAGGAVYAFWKRQHPNMAAGADSQRVVVTIDQSQVGPEQVKAKLEQIGYQVAPKDK